MEGSRYFQTPYLYKENGFKEKAYAEKLIQELSVSQPLKCTVEKSSGKKRTGIRRFYLTWRSFRMCVQAVQDQPG